jgi:hypothetical protein
MNMLVKSAVASALALSATGAFALGVPSTNSSDLVLVVQNAANPSAVYALDTGISISSLLPTSGFVSGAVLNTTAFAGINKTISESTTLQSFLAANPASGDAWTLEAAQFTTTTGTASTSNIRAAGTADMIATSATGTTNNTTVSAKQLSNLVAFVNGLNGDVVNNNGGLYGLNNPTPVTETTNAAFSVGIAQDKYTFMTVNDMSAVGTASQLFAFTGNGGTGKLQSYILGSATLGTNGTLTLTGNSTVTAPVPLPAAVWLFGSGLMGLVGVSRRRKAAV